MAPSRGMDELHFALCWLMMAAGAIVFPYLLATNVSARYGRYSASNSQQQVSRWWGPLINAKVAWMAQEVPSLLVPIIIALAVPHASFSVSAPRTWLTAAFITHYTHRALIYPWIIRGGKGTAVTVWAAAFMFCIWNGFLQGWFLVQQMPAEQPWRPHHVIGLLLWLGGWLANLQADGILRNLRASSGDTGYKIPHGGLFEYVSAANYFAETCEWVGYAIAGWSLAPAAFAWATIANLAPRAASHHRWYQERFREEYPPGRKAFLPYIW